MGEPGDAPQPRRPVASAPAASPDTLDAGVDAPDDRAMRRAALRDLAAMIGVEVFY